MSQLSIPHTLSTAPPKIEQATTGRLYGIDALRGFAIIAMALDHAAAAIYVSLQAESYGGITPILGRWPSWVMGMFTNVASPTFWMLAGVSIYLYAASRLRKGETNAEITRFLLTRAALLAMLDLTVAWAAWHASTPYTHVLLSIAIALALVTLLRLLPTPLITIISVGWLIAYQLAIPFLNHQFGNGVAYWQALLAYFSYTTFPATEFSILGWGSLMLVGVALGPIVLKPAWMNPQMWVMVGGGLLLAWLGLRFLGGFGDLGAYTADQPPYYFFIMSKTPPSLTFMLFNFGITALVYAFFLTKQSWLALWPLKWLVILGQVSLFAFVTHLVIYGLLGRIIVSYPVPLPGVIQTVLLWLVGLALLIPLSAAYRRLRMRYPQSILRFL